MTYSFASCALERRALVGGVPVVLIAGVPGDRHRSRSSCDHAAPSSELSRRGCKRASPSPADAVRIRRPGARARIDPWRQRGRSVDLAHDEAIATKLPIEAALVDDCSEAHGCAWRASRRIPGYYLNADACADLALRAAPGDPAALDLRAMVLLNQHRFDEARALSERIVLRVAGRLRSHTAR